MSATILSNTEYATSGYLNGTVQGSSANSPAEQPARSCPTEILATSSTMLDWMVRWFSTKCVNTRVFAQQVHDAWDPKGFRCTVSIAAGLNI